MNEVQIQGGVATSSERSFASLRMTRVLFSRIFEGSLRFCSRR